MKYFIFDETVGGDGEVTYANTLKKANNEAWQLWNHLTIEEKLTRFISVGIGETDNIDDLYNTTDGGFCSDNIYFVAQSGYANSPKSECYGLNAAKKELAEWEDIDKKRGDYIGDFYAIYHIKNGKMTEA